LANARPCDREGLIDRWLDLDTKLDDAVPADAFEALGTLQYLAEEFSRHYYDCHEVGSIQMQRLLERVLCVLAKAVFSGQAAGTPQAAR
jgi:hypothetical protein